MILGMNVGFSLRVAARSSAQMKRQDGETERAHISLTLLAEDRAKRDVWK